MADATRLHVMSKQIDEQKQVTEAISTQIEKLTQSCGQIETLVQSQRKLESMITAFMSHSIGQQGRTLDPSCSLSGGITSSSQGLKPPDPPDLVGSGQISDVKRANELEPVPLLPLGMSTRLTKVGFPMFDGTKFRDWVYRCEQFFRLDGTPLELKAELAAAHLEGKALQFHQNFLNSRYGRLPSWTEYVLALANRFGEAYDDPLADLVSLKQSGDTVEVYLDKFECALTRLSLPEPHALSIFLTNLNPKLALYIRGQKASTVTEAAKLARLHESYLLQTPQQTRAPFSPYQKAASPPRNKTAPPLLPDCSSIYARYTSR